MSYLHKIFALNRGKADWRRALELLAALIVLLAVSWAMGISQYFYSLAFGVLFTGLIDPGGSFASRLRKLAGFAVVGAAATAAAYALGGWAWYWMAAAAFVVTVASSLSVRYGVHRFVAAVLLNVWFLIVLSLPSGFAVAGERSALWGQAAAWLAGCGLWLAVTFVAWILHGRTDRPAWVPEIPGDTSRHALTGPVIAYAVLRGLAMAITVGIAFGLKLPNGIWLPIPALVAMKPTLDQATLTAAQRLAGALIGAAVAAGLLVTVGDKAALAVITLAALALAAAIRTVNYALYTAAMAAGVLIALELPHFTGLTAEGERVGYTLVGCGIALLLMGVASLLKKSGKGRPPQKPETGAGSTAAG